MVSPAAESQGTFCAQNVRDLLCVVDKSMKKAKSVSLIHRSGNLIHRKPAEKPLSLHPLKFEEAVTGLLRVQPNDGSVRPSESERGRHDGQKGNRGSRRGRA